VREVVVYGDDLDRDRCRTWPRHSLGHPAEPVGPGGETFGKHHDLQSGTTGKPKGALRRRSDRELVLALLNELDMRFGEEVTSPPGRSTTPGQRLRVLSHTLGGTVVILRKFDAPRMGPPRQPNKVTSSFSAPTQLKRIVALPDDVLHSRPHTDALPDRQTPRRCRTP